MKKTAINLFFLAMCFALISVSPAVNAQKPGRGDGRGPGFEKGEGVCRIPDLSDEQRASIEKLRITHFRNAELIRAEIGEKQARLNTLKLAENPDVKAIDKTIDEISSLRGNLLKAREAHQREVKALLNENQKVFFDSKQGRGRNRGEGHRRNGMGFRHGCNRDCPVRD